MKIINDKYYTPADIALYCINKTKEKLNTTFLRVIEPSAGNGAFSSQIDNCIALDISPEKEGIIKQDFLTWGSQYEKGTLVIGNPPYGEKMNLAQKFFKKSIQIGDYIAFILPISQLWNTSSLFEFDLIHSEDLGKTNYSGHILHCCFNIYKRPENGLLNKKTLHKLTDVSIVRNDSKKFWTIDSYDLRMCYWGDGSAGKILREGEHYSAEYKIIVNDPEIKQKVVEVLSIINWKEELNCIAMLKIQQFHIVKVLKKYIPNIM